MLTQPVAFPALSPTLSQFLETLSTLPPDAPEWMEWDAFLSALHRLRSARDELIAQAAIQAQRMARFRQAAVDALAELTAVPLSLREFFSLDDPIPWDVTFLSDDLLEETSALLSRLLADLAEYERVDYAARASLLAKRELRPALMELEARVEELLTKLNAAFDRGAPPEPPASPAPLVPPAQHPEPLSEPEPHDEPPLPAPVSPNTEIPPAPSPTGVPPSNDVGALLLSQGASGSVPLDAMEDTEPGTEAPEPLPDISSEPRAGLPPAPSLDATPAPVVAFDGADYASPDDVVDSLLVPAVEEERFASEALEADGLAVETIEAETNEAETTEAETIEEDTDLALPALELAGNGRTDPLPDDAARIRELWPFPPQPPRILPTPTPQQLSETLWALLEAGNLAHAYWLAISSELQQSPLSVPAWLLAALQASWWLQTARGTLAQDLAELSSRDIPDNELCLIIATSAALLPSLTAPASNLVLWLDSTAHLPEATHAIVAAVRAFALYGHPLVEADLQMIRGVDQRAAMIESIEARAKRWLEDETQRRTSFHRATAVWNLWARSSGPLGTLLGKIAGGAAPAAEVRDLVDEWRSVGIVERINQTDIAIRGKLIDRKSRLIEGAAQLWLISQASDAIDLAEEWIEWKQGGKSSPGWYLDRVEQLHAALVSNLSDARAQLLDMLSSEAEPAAHQGALHLLWALNDLGTLFGFTPVALPPRATLSFPAAVDIRLQSGLDYHLLFIPYLDLGDGSVLSPDETSALAALLWQLNNQPPSPSQVVEMHLARGNFRLSELLARNLPSAQRAAVAARIQEQREKAEAAVSQGLAILETAVAHAEVNDLLDERQRSEFLGHAEAIRSHLGDDLYRQHRQLEDLIDALSTLREQRLAQQVARWTRIRARLSEQHFADTAPDVHNQVAVLVDQLLKQRDFVVLSERLARLEELLDQGELPRPEEFTPRPERDAYYEFCRTVAMWSDNARLHDKVLVESLKVLRRGGLPGPLRLGKISKQRVEEVREALSAWYQLSTVDPEASTATVRQAVEKMLRYIGFQSVQSVARPVRIANHGPDYVHLTAQVTAGNLSPVPQYGSQHVEPFDILCFWGQPTAEAVTSRVHNLHLGTRHILVFVLSPLKRNQRLHFGNLAREQGLSMLLLDEYLTCFLARKVARLSVFFQCALPLARVAPYAETGPVAPEMFKGRLRELQALQAESGYAMVYGGRQLGKSALLQQVEREFHRPAENRYVIRADIKHVGDPLSAQADPDLIWQRLKTGLESQGLLERTSATKPATIVENIRTTLRANPQRRILVLFDEADNFLAADQQRQFEIVSTLRTLMDESQRRFKVVFAGLHNVQRYEGVPNQPFAHLPGLEIGPLEPQAAKDLIRAPLEALGFRLDTDDLAPILSILAYTNSHPGLIQLFCQKLLAMLYGRRLDRLAPIAVSRQDVEEVYRQRDVQTEIRRRFEWTLGLDPRYKALAEIMVVEQLDERDGFARPYSATDLRTLGQIYWPQAFDNTPLDEFRGYLNEMVGLGVLVRTQRNEYRLRSPNLARLMGTAEDIRASLEELSQRQGNPAFMPDSQHAAMDEEAKRYSPFTFAQSRNLNAPQHGVGLVFGSDALGLLYAAEAFNRHFIPPGANGHASEIHIASQRGEALKPWLRRFEEDNPSSERLIVFRRMTLTKESMAEQVEAALEFCRRRLQNRRRWMRIIFLFDPDATYEWMTLSSDRRKEYEAESDAVVLLQRWNETGIAQRLRQHDKQESNNIIRRLMAETSGWPWLLDRLADGWQDGDDPLQGLEKYQNDLARHELRARFLRATGATLNPGVVELLKSMSHFEPLTQDLMVPELLGVHLNPDDLTRRLEYLQYMDLIQPGPKPKTTIVNPVVKEYLTTAL